MSKLGNTTNAWVIEASTFKGPFAMFKDFVPSVDRMGEPQSYDASGFPASKSMVLLLSNCLKEVYFIPLTQDCTVYTVILIVSPKVFCSYVTYYLGAAAYLQDTVSFSMNRLHLIMFFFLNFNIKIYLYFVVGLLFCLLLF